MDTAHEFNPAVAERYGINAAVIFQHIAYLSQESPTRWVDLSIEELVSKYPYMGRKAIWLALQRLISPGPKTADLVSRKPRETGIGFLYAPVARDGFCDIPHKFSVELATKLGVVPAIVYRNVSFFIRKNWVEKADAAYDKLNPKEFDWDEYVMRQCAYDNTRKAAAHFGTVDAWVEHHPYVTLRSAFRGFACLLDEGMLTRTYLKHNIPLWHLPARI